MINASEFVASINRDGVVNSNRFKVTFRLPNYLSGQLAGLTTTSDILRVLGINPAVPSQVIGGITDAALGTTKQITLRCDGAQLPGMTHGSVDGMPRLGYGAIEEMPYAPIFDNLSLTFLLERQASIHKLFYDWSNAITNYQSEGQSRMTQLRSDNKGPVAGMAAYEVGFKDDYVTDIQIDVYDTNDKRILSAIAYRAHPKGIPPLDMNWQDQNSPVRLQIPFAFTDFKIRYNNDLFSPLDVPTELEQLGGIALNATGTRFPSIRSLIDRIF